MGKINRGKQFEGVIRASFNKVPNTFVMRLPDPTQGYLGYRNICDFLIYHYPHIYCIECKTTHAKSLSIYSPNEKKRYGAITNNQWEGLLNASNIDGVIAGVICWYVEFDKTVFYPIRYLRCERKLGVKSINADKVDSESGCVEIDGHKKRILYDYDMNKFFDNFISC